MHPFISQDPPAEYTTLEWRCEDTSIVVLRNFGNLGIQVWIHPPEGTEGYPDVAGAQWAVDGLPAVLEIVAAIARVLGPLAQQGPLRGRVTRPLRHLAMKEYGDVFDGTMAKLYNRTEPRGENPWLDEVAQYEEEQETGIRRHRFKLNVEAPTIVEAMYGRPRSRTPGST